MLNFLLLILEHEVVTGEGFSHCGDAEWARSTELALVCWFPHQVSAALHKQVYKLSTVVPEQF